MANCETCPNNQGYNIFERSADNRLAVERCDSCMKYSSDESAAIIARAAGILCESVYPCYIIEESD